MVLVWSLLGWSERCGFGCQFWFWFFMCVHDDVIWSLLGWSEGCVCMCEILECFVCVDDDDDVGGWQGFWFSQLQAQLGRVVVGMRHPLSHFQGKAIDALRGMGVRVDVGGEELKSGEGAIAVHIWCFSLSLLPAETLEISIPQVVLEFEFWCLRIVLFAGFLSTARHYLFVADIF